MDFVCIERKLVIEVDGGQHGENIESDNRRSKYLKEEGYRIMRFWNHEVLQEGEMTLNMILSCLTEVSPSPQPSPPKSGGEGDRAELKKE